MSDHFCYFHFTSLQRKENSRRSRLEPCSSPISWKTREFFATDNTLRDYLRTGKLASLLCLIRFVLETRNLRGFRHIRAREAKTQSAFEARWQTWHDSNDMKAAAAAKMTFRSKGRCEGNLLNEWGQRLEVYEVSDRILKINSKSGKFIVVFCPIGLNSHAYRVSTLTIN